MAHLVLGTTLVRNEVHCTTQMAEAIKSLKYHERWAKHVYPRRTKLPSFQSCRTELPKAIL